MRSSPASLASLASLLPVSALAFAGLAALANPAAAQSGPPGQCACTPPPGAFGPAGAPGWTPPPEPWEAQRFGIGLRLGGIGLEDRVGNGSEEKQEFSAVGLSLRYRALQHIELELAFDHGQQQLEDGTTTDLELSTVTASVLLHMRPQAAWNWYLLGGIGVNDRRYKGDADEYADQRAQLALGAGVERRFEHLVLGLEVRALAIGPRDENDRGDVINAAVVQPEDEGLSGGQLSLSAGWYF
jgi:hypothetical protein